MFRSNTRTDDPIGQFLPNRWIPSPQNRTADARDARRVRGRGAPRRLDLARPAHLPHLARRRERHPLKNGLLVGDVGDGCHRAVGAGRWRRRPRGGGTRRLVARQRGGGAHGAVASVSSTWNDNDHFNHSPTFSFVLRGLDEVRKEGIPSLQPEMDRCLCLLGGALGCFGASSM